LKRTSEFASWFQTAVSTGIDFDRLKKQLSEGVGRLLAHPLYQADAHVWMTGSGDSLFAAQIALPALERWVGLRGSVVSAMEFARYRVPLLTPQDSLWAISNSGSAARTRETVSLAKTKGILTVGITGSETGPLASMADSYIFRPVEDIPAIPEINRGIFMNMNEFLVTLYSLYFTGLHLGVARGAIAQEEVDLILSKCEAAIHSVGPIAGQIEASSARLATEISGLDTIWIIGAGPSFGTARYCAAKFHEQLPWNGIPEDLEEWAHLQYFLTLSWKERSSVFVLAPQGNSLDRAQELVAGIAGVGGRAFVVAGPNHGSFPGATQEFRLPGISDEFLSAFTYHLPVQMLILHLAAQSGVDPYALRRADSYQLIRHGVVLQRPDTLA
jgi:glucosamine--fructose-6-phosphate aminotransferase (isomerizing)